MGHWSFWNVEIVDGNFSLQTPNLGTAFRGVLTFGNSRILALQYGHFGYVWRHAYVGCDLRHETTGTTWRMSDHNDEVNLGRFGLIQGPNRVYQNGSAERAHITAYCIGHSLGGWDTNNMAIPGSSTGKSCVYQKMPRVYVATDVAGAEMNLAYYGCLAEWGERLCDEVPSNGGGGRVFMAHNTFIASPVSSSIAELRNDLTMYSNLIDWPRFAKLMRSAIHNRVVIDASNAAAQIAIVSNTDLDWEDSSEIPGDPAFLIEPSGGAGDLSGCGNRAWHRPAATSPAALGLSFKPGGLPRHLGLRQLDLVTNCGASAFNVDPRDTALMTPAVVIGSAVPTGAILGRHAPGTVVSDGDARIAIDADGVIARAGSFTPGAMISIEMIEPGGGVLWSNIRVVGTGADVQMQVAQADPTSPLAPDAGVPPAPFYIDGCYREASHAATRGAFRVAAQPRPDYFKRPFKHPSFGGQEPKPALLPTDVPNCANSDVTPHRLCAVTTVGTKRKATADGG